eukprot:gene9359-12609_t
MEKSNNVSQICCSKPKRSIDDLYEHIQLLVLGDNDNDNYSSERSIQSPLHGKNTVSLRKTSATDNDLYVGKKISGIEKDSVIREIVANQYIKSRGSHKNIAEFTEAVFDEDETNIYFISKYYRGSDLFEYILNYGGPINEATASRIFSDLLDGVEFLHKNSIAHNDLSAMNVLLESNNSVRIIDFEMSLRVSSNSLAQYVPIDGNSGGTLKYAAPENDIWSLGAILFFMIVGCELYELPSFNDARFKYAIIDGNLKKLLHIWNKKVSEDVIDLMSKILQYNPSDIFNEHS